ncbi:hypothetical protein [uncultured Barnesiella sp.]|uniref:hypothetical protein n=1 Tax=uncultured Barnesiella sp. TaxID=584861 RepID=UPI002607D929|nr:hypothetical protein [uncultured Barnesiella sp.]
MKIVLLPFGLPVVVDRFLFLCLAIAEKGEVSRSDGGVENLSVTVSLNPLAYGTPPIFPLRETQGESLNVTSWHLQEAQKRLPLACGAPPIFPLWRTQGESLNVTPWHLQEAQKRKPYVTAYGTPLYFLAENTGGEVNFPLHHPHRNYSGLNFFNNNFVVFACRNVKYTLHL